jgi:hypothetical protein
LLKGATRLIETSDIGGAVNAGLATEQYVVLRPRPADLVRAASAGRESHVARRTSGKCRSFPVRRHEEAAGSRPVFA